MDSPFEISRYTTDVSQKLTILLFVSLLKFFLRQ